MLIDDIIDGKDNGISFTSNKDGKILITLITPRAPFITYVLQ